MNNRFYFLALTLFLSICSFAQTAIPNGGFENWSFAFPPFLFADPNSWGSSDKVIEGLSFKDPKFVEKETKSAYVYKGTASVRLRTDTTTVTIPTTTFGILFTIPGYINLGDLSFNILTRRLTRHGIAYTSRPDSLVFAYRYETDSSKGDSGTVAVSLTLTQPGDTNLTIGTVNLNVGRDTGWVISKSKVIYESLLAPDSLTITASSSKGLAFIGGTVGSTFWIDDMKFVGIDTTFHVYISPHGNRAICSADTFRLHTDSIVGSTYQWYKGGLLINGATNPSYFVINAPDDYAVKVTRNSVTLSSDTIKITVNPSPTVSLNGNPDTLCRSGNTITLTGGSPTGGLYTIDNGFFPTTTLNPKNQTGGNHVIHYAVTQGQCTSLANEAIFIDTGYAISLAGVPDTFTNLSLILGATPTGGFYTINTGTAPVGTIDASQYLEDTLVLHYTVANQSGCNNTAQKTVYLKRIATGLHDMTNSEVKIYPNPATTYITIEMSYERANATLTDLQGRIVAHQSLIAGLSTMDISQIESGSYLMGITDEVSGYTKVFKTLITNR